MTAGSPPVQKQWDQQAINQRFSTFRILQPFDTMFLMSNHKVIS